MYNSTLGRVNDYSKPHLHLPQLRDSVLAGEMIPQSRRRAQQKKVNREPHQLKIGEEYGKITAKLTPTDEKILRCLIKIMGRRKPSSVSAGLSYYAASQEAIAKEVGCARETVSRRGKYLEEHGVIVRDKLAWRYTNHTLYYAIPGAKPVAECKNYTPACDKEPPVVTNIIATNVANYVDKSINQEEISKPKENSGTGILPVSKMWEVAQEELPEVKFPRLDKWTARRLGAARKVYFQTEEKLRAFLRDFRWTKFYADWQKAGKAMVGWLLSFRIVEWLLGGWGVRKEDKKRREEARMRERKENEEILGINEEIQKLQESDECEEIKSAKRRLLSITHLWAYKAATNSEKTEWKVVNGRVVAFITERHPELDRWEKVRVAMAQCGIWTAPIHKYVDCSTYRECYDLFEELSDKSEEEIAMVKRWREDGELWWGGSPDWKWVDGDYGIRDGMWVKAG